MAWICPICSTNNEDTEEVCKVCDFVQKKVIRTLTKKRVKELGLSGHVTIPEPFNVIGEGAFEGRRDILSVALHKGVKRISRGAFASCVNLEEVTQGTGLKSICSRAFFRCEALDSSFKDTVKYVAEDAFLKANNAPKRGVRAREEKLEEPSIAEECTYGITVCTGKKHRKKAGIWFARGIIGCIAVAVICGIISLIIG